MERSKPTTRDICPQNASTIHARLEPLGLLDPVSGGIQIDINAAARRTADGRTIGASLCDHNCTMTVRGRKTGGSYTCPASFSLNRGIDRKSLAPAENIIKGIDNAADGIRKANSSFVDRGFQTYCSRFRVPDRFATLLRQSILSGRVEVNLFGGNPEMHPDIAQIISELRRREYIVNLTTTGRRFMRDPAFLETVMQTPPHVIALSADDFASPEQIYRLASLPARELYKEWMRIPRLHGQKQKAYEALYVARRIVEQRSCAPKLLFNLVIHPGNIESILQVTHAIAECIPGCLLSPYPAQTAFMRQPPAFAERHTYLLEQFIDGMIEHHTAQQSDRQPTHFVRRLHYWLALKAIFEIADKSRREVCDYLSGYGVWKCYRAFGANRYLQIGRPSQDICLEGISGGYLGCFWSPCTVAANVKQAWDLSGADVARYVMTDHQLICVQPENRCPGCEFPRLMFDVVSTELGLSGEIASAYLPLRERYAGY